MKKEDFPRTGEVSVVVMEGKELVFKDETGDKFHLINEGFVGTLMTGLYEEPIIVVRIPDPRNCHSKGQLMLAGVRDGTDTVTIWEFSVGMRIRWRNPAPLRVAFPAQTAA